MSQPAKDPWDDDEIDKPPVGIGGMLWLVLLHLIATPALIVLSMLKLAKPLSLPANVHELTGHPLFLALTALVALAMLAQLLFGLFCLVQFLRKRAAVPRLMTVWYGLGITVSVLAAIQFAVNADVFTKIIDATATSGSIGRGATLTFVFSGFLIVYFDVSKRVKNTFVR